MTVIETEAPRADRTSVAPAHAGAHLLVAIPALNEGATLGQVLAGVPRTLPGVGRVDVLVVDDGSTDDTAAVAQAAGALVVRHPTNRGVGAAFHTALATAVDLDVDLLVTLDADGQFDPRDIPALVTPALAGDADFVTASRFLDPALTPPMPWVKRWGNRRMSALISRLAGARFADVSCGMRCYTRRALLRLNVIGRFTYTQEVFLDLAWKGLRLTEVPIRVHPRRQGESRVARSVFAYGWRASQIILRCYRDYFPMRFFGGLALALLLPAAGLGAFLLAHYARTGAFSPHKWAGFTSGTLVVLALALLHMGLIGDLLVRHRLYLEELLALSRRSPAGDRPRPGADEDAPCGS
ncbi:MAG: glycosyltransferase family 2 protein [Planctomycetes bacterium]|nr:glycosyltransferase family 2 protein [Planctomycetota bacterium]